MNAVAPSLNNATKPPAEPGGFFFTHGFVLEHLSTGPLISETFGMG